MRKVAALVVAASLLCPGGLSARPFEGTESTREAALLIQGSGIGRWVEQRGFGPMAESLATVAWKFSDSDYWRMMAREAQAVPAVAVREEPKQLPLPASVWMIGLAFAALGGLALRRKQSV